MRHVHVVAQPITKYLQFEFGIYAQAEKFETINIVPATSVGVLKGDALFMDFLLFDDRFLFLNDYDENGLPLGGYKVDDQVAVELAKQIKKCLLKEAMPFRDFIKKQGGLLLRSR